MENNNIVALQNKIVEGLLIAAQKLIETKKQNHQKMVVSVEGKIQIITP
jgi:urease accessory protein UreF